MSFVLGTVVGLLVGWNFLQQPVVVKKVVDKVLVKLGVKKD